ncbi:MAG: hypothetical protein WCL49_12420 [bacterium]
MTVENTLVGILLVIAVVIAVLIEKQTVHDYDQDYDRDYDYSQSHSDFFHGIDCLLTKLISIMVDRNSEGGGREHAMRLSSVVSACRGRFSRPGLENAGGAYKLKHVLY